MNNFWVKFKTFYQSKSLVNKLFLWKNMYHLRMEVGDLVTEYLKAFTVVVNEFLSVDIKNLHEDK